MRSLGEAVRLNSGHAIPWIGLGTYQMRGAECREAVTAALECGYRHIDTAVFYQNEEVVGEVIRRYNRSELFITSKIPPNCHGFDKAIETTQQSLQHLGVDYLDLMLIHWPGVAGTSPSDPRSQEIRAQTWAALEKMQREGKIRSIGVSNYLIRHLEPLLKTCSIRPAVNQFEYHPLCQNEELVQFCASNGILVEAYSSLARGDAELFHSPKVQAIASGHGVSVGQVLLRWGLQKGVVVLPKSRQPDRVRTNAQLQDFQLNAQEMATLNGMNKDKHTCWNPQSVA